MSLKDNVILKWNIDTEIGLIINEIAESKGLSTAEVKEILMIYYHNIDQCMEFNSLPMIRFIGIGKLKAPPSYINSYLQKAKPSLTEADKQKKEELMESMRRRIGEKIRRKEIRVKYTKTIERIKNEQKNVNIGEHKQE